MSRSNWLLGAVLILLGGMLLLNNLGITDIDVGYVVSTYWPLLLAFWGLNIIVKERSGGSLLSGGILLAVGLLLQVRNMGLLDFSMADFWKFFWPLILILAGISLLKGPLSGGKNNVAFMGGLEKTKGHWKLENANYWAFMGGVELDLRRAEIEKGEYLLNCTAIMGGVDIIVPQDLNVICNGTAVLGGVELLGESSGGIIGSASASQEVEGPVRATVKIYGRALMGGIEVKARD